MAASHSAGDRACSKSLRTSSMIPSNWSPTRGCFRASSRASCSSRRCRQTQRCKAQGILAQAAAAVDEKADAQPARRVPHAIEAKQQQVGDQDAEGRRGDRFDHLDRPDPAAKLVQLGLKRIRQP